MRHGGLLLLMSLLSPLGCDGENRCENLCRAIEQKVEDQLNVEIDCSEEKWTSAKTCAECLFVLERDYDASLINEEEVCREYFGESDGG